MPGRFDTVDAYIASLEGDGLAMAKRLRTLIRTAVPEATETIRYDMPAFQLGGRSFLFFAIWKKHAGVYPVYRGDDAFEAHIAPYRAKKDTIQFRYDRPLPEDLVIEIARRQAAST